MAKCAALFQSLKEYPDDFERARDAYYSWERAKNGVIEPLFDSTDDKNKGILDEIRYKSFTKAKAFAKEHKLELLKMSMSTGRRTKPVLKVDINNLEIQMFSSMQEASEDTNIWPSDLSKFISQKKVVHNAYYFKASDL